MRIAADRDGVPGRSLLVALGIGAFVWWISVSVKAFRAQDEFSQRIHLLATAATFVLAVLFSFSADVLHNAGLIRALPMGGFWMGMVVVWGLSIAAASSWFNR
jgi:hypothetical protein